MVRSSLAQLEREGLENAYRKKKKKKKKKKGRPLGW
jgi:hypothetical protein